MGDWIGENIFSIISLLTTVVGGIIAFVRLQSSVKFLTAKIEIFEADFKTLDKELMNHKTDDDSHVNHLYMKSLKEKIDTIESEQKEFRKSIENKLDSLSEKIYDNK